PMNGGSYTASFGICAPLAAVSSARPAPEDVPNTNALPPAAAINACTSSTSRVVVYGGVSPLEPRPRRSYRNTVKLGASSFAILGLGPNSRLHIAPSISTTGGPLPSRSYAIRVPSFEMTSLMTASRSARGRREIFHLVERPNLELRHFTRHRV